ncbi:GlxA family transcriptional regulator [Yokenella regensburgei]|uniref:GlxA family transcriptional regulator n=1 Tax=Yokenella regensburgei TaxID=158877 RepID=UPI0031DBEED5
MTKPPRDISWQFIDEIDNLPDGWPNGGAPELNVGILLWPEFPLMSLAGLLDALRHAADMGDNSQQVRCSWTIMSHDPGLRVASSSGITIQPDCGFLPPETFDYVVVIGGLLRSLHAGSPPGREYLRGAYAAGVPVAGVCTGSFVLAEEGLMAGRRASLHPFHIADFRARFPGVYAETGSDFIDDRGVLTCPGGISTIGLASELIRRHCGPDRATKAIHQMAVPNRIDAAPVSVSRALGFTRVADGRLRRAVFLIEQSLVRPVSTEWLAGQVNISARQLTRLFRQEFDQTPGEFIRAARLKYGRWLLKNSAESVTEIALRTGFSDCAHFIRAFRQQYQCTPGDYRASRGAVSEGYRAETVCPAPPSSSPA